MSSAKPYIRRQIRQIKDANGNGLLVAGGNAVKIAGWNADVNSLYSTYEDSPQRVFMCTGTQKPYTIGGYTDYWYFGAGSSNGDGFGVSTAGVLCASGAKISGDITADSGLIGGWNIDKTRMWNTDESVVFYPDRLVAQEDDGYASVEWLKVARAGQRVADGITSVITIDGKDCTFISGILVSVEEAVANNE